MSTRIDMTPMVDLAFLLLTFFMLTTTFAKPYTMELTMPVKSNEPSSVKQSEAMTIMLGKNHRVYYFLGLNAPQDKSVPLPKLQTTTFAANGIRQALRAQQRQAAGSWWCSSSPRRSEIPGHGGHSGRDEHHATSRNTPW